MQCIAMGLLWYSTSRRFVQGKKITYKWRMSLHFAMPCQFPPTTDPQWPKNYLGKKQSAGFVSTIEWSAQLPDFNPIELLWEQLCTYGAYSTYEVPIRSAFKCNKFPSEMPKVCRAVTAVNGGYFEFMLYIRSLCLPFPHILTRPARTWFLYICKVSSMGMASPTIVCHSGFG